MLFQGGRAASTLLAAFGLLSFSANALRYNSTLDPWNVNKNQDAEDVLDYTTNRKSSYYPSPDNWREHPCYTLLLDKWMDGDPENNDYYSLTHEWGLHEITLRAGGDTMGLMSNRSLDYLQSMGYTCIYMAGTPFLNMPWQADSYSVIDFSLVDPHYGVLQDWINLMDEMHRRGMYMIADFTVGTMGDMIGVQEHLNSSAPFDLNEYEVIWKRPPYAPWGFDYYPDFNYTNTYNDSCQLPTFWYNDGSVVDPGKTGCYASQFDQYGDVEAFGVFPDWMRQLAKFASVQDRLREWYAPAGDRIKRYSCLFIEATDIDGIRIDKATQVTVQYMSEWSAATKQCAAELGKDNFIITGEVTGGDTFGALYMGRGRTPNLRPPDFDSALNVTQADSQYFLRGEDVHGIDSIAFHFSIYRSLARFLGMDGNLQVAYDVPNNFVDAWRTMIVNNDFLNHKTGQLDPRHQFGTVNQDVFRWPALINGTHKQQLGQFISNVLFPGVPLLWYGEEQAMYLFDNGAANYMYGRQTMVSSEAWVRHGCYGLGSEQYYNFPVGRGFTGCEDRWNALDHFDPTAEALRGLRSQHFLRANYPAILDGFGLEQLGNWTEFIQLPGSNITGTELGMWSVARAPVAVQQGTGNFNADGVISQVVWLLYSNENRTITQNTPCNQEGWVSSPYQGGTTVQNLFWPFDSILLEDSLDPFFADDKAPYRGCLPSITLKPWEYKVYVPQAQWRRQRPAMTKFTPGHDARVPAPTGGTIDIAIEYDTEMSCDSFQQAMSLVYSGDASGTPTISQGACARIPDADIVAPELVGVAPSSWRWTGQIENAGEGIYEIIITPVAAESGANLTTQGTDHLLLRAGGDDNPMVNPNIADYRDDLLTKTDGKYMLNQRVPGADMYRWSADFTQNWSPWTAYQAGEVELNATMFDNEDLWWDGHHVQVQYWSQIAMSSNHMLHGDADYNGPQRRYPQLLARGLFNNWGFDLGAKASFKNDNDSSWTFAFMAAWPASLQLNVFAYNDYFMGDYDNDGVLDRLAPNALTPNFLNMSQPPSPHLGWNVLINDATGRWSVVPVGQESTTIIAFALLLILPVITAMVSAMIFRYTFYSIKVNKWGMKPSKESYFPIIGGHKEKSGDMNEKAVALNTKSSKPPGKIIGWPEDPNKRRKVLIATLEYEIIDWKIKVKIGGLGVMSTLMGKAMTDVDLIWVIPKVQDLEYPQGEYAEPIEVIIFGEPYLIEVETHQLDNITYIILDSPVFRAQTKSDPYPQRMDDLSSAIFYSTWNQAIAEAVRRNPIVDIYHINDYHGALVPLYLFPKVLPVCLSLHNAEFQGLWPLRTKDEMKEVCAAFNIPKEVCSKYVQFGNTFNLLHAAASYISHHQKSVGVAGVSDKYGKRSWARYPALWTLRNIDSLPNPDPTDIAALEAQPLAINKVEIDEDAESKRPEQKRQAQEWAGIKQDPNADLFVFVGRWSKQKGVDLIADVMPALLDKKPKMQLICVGPVIDLYGRFAAEKLARLMEMYPDRVFSKPEFTALPPYLFSGADFALIPSRDEPFGLVAVEFGRKGALGVGARLGGLGLMPGWWFPVESSATVHMLSQLTKTIKLALKSTNEERAILRARSAVQRFPVVEWRQRLEDFQKRSINASRHGAGENAWGFDQVDSGRTGFYAHDVGSNVSLAQFNRPGTPDSIASAPPSPMPDSRRLSHSPHSADPNQGYFDNQLTTGAAYHDRFNKRDPKRGSAESFYDEEPNASELYYDDNKRRSAKPKFFQGSYDDEDVPSSQGSSDHGDAHTLRSQQPGETPQAYDNFLAAANRQFSKQSGGRNQPDPYFQNDSSRNSVSEGFAPSRPFTMHSRTSSFDSISSIVDEKGTSSPLNKAMDNFTDSDGEVAQSFVQKLRDLSSDNSKGDLCIEKFLIKSEKAFFDEIKKEKMSSSAMSIKSSRDSFMASRPASVVDGFRPESPYSLSGHGHDDSADQYGGHGDYEEPNIHDKPMTKIQILLQRSAFGWPMYTVIIALGQLLSATSFQLSLLSGSNTLKETDLYIICSVFVAGTLAWYTLFRMRPSVWVLSAPWVVFGCAFFMIGLPSLYGPFTPPRVIIQRVSVWLYAFASSAGFLFFGLNFGDEAGAATEIWVTRACIVQGLQQIWVSALWYWGYTLNGQDPASFVVPRVVIIITWPLAAISFAFSALMFWGLPEFYHQIPPYVPNFFKTLFRRKLVIWFLISGILRDYWLSGPYGRNWQFLWQAADIPKWAVVVMILIFFIGIWGALLGVLIKYSKVHSWLVPVFAIGLGAPRWCQIWWGTSGMGVYVPWAGAAGPYVGVGLWLWLGVLDAIQGAGLGMILLQTLSRLHVCATLALAQFIGSVTVMVARATSPTKVGPGNAFPNPGIWDVGQSGNNNPFGYWEFWVCLFCQIIIVIGFAFLFRKEQLSKP